MKMLLVAIGFAAFCLFPGQANAYDRCDSRGYYGPRYHHRHHVYVRSFVNVLIPPFIGPAFRPPPPPYRVWHRPPPPPPRPFIGFGFGF